MKKIILMLMAIFLISCSTTQNDNTLNEIQNDQTSEVTSDTLDDSNTQDVNDADSGENVNEEPSEDNQDQASEETLVRYKVMVDILNVRATPTTESDVVGQVFIDGVYEVLEEKLVEVDDKEELWLKVNIYGYTGWLAGWFCEVTEDDLRDYTPRFDEVAFELHKYYLLGHQFDIQSDYFDVDITLNDSTLEDNILDRSGTLSVNFTDPLGRVHTYHGNVIVKEEATYYKALYADKDVNSEILGFEDEIDLNYDDSEAYISLGLDGLEVWYKAKYKGKSVYYHRNTYHNNSYITVDKFYFNTANGVREFETTGYISPKLLDHGIIILDQDYTENTFIDMMSGEVYYFDTYDYSEEDHYLVSYYAHNEYYNKEGPYQYDFKVYQVDKGLDLIYEASYLDEGINNIIFDQGIYYSRYYEITNEFGSASGYHYEEKYMLDTNMVNHHLEKDIDQVNTNQTMEMTLYSEMNMDSEPLGKAIINTEDLTFTRHIQVKNERLYNWYKFNLDGQEHYVYRERTENDGMRIKREEDLVFILNDGVEYVEKAGYGEDFHVYSTVIRDGLLYKDLLVFNAYYEGVSIHFVDMNTGKRVDAPFYGEFVVDKAEDLLIVHESFYYDGYQVTVLVKQNCNTNQ